MKWIISLALACAALLVGGVGSASALTPIVHKDGAVLYVNACGDSMTKGNARCSMKLLSDAAGKPMALTSPDPSALTPAQLRAAYGVTGLGSPSTTIAVVDAYGYANAEQDLAVYRKQFGLPPCTTANGCFKKVNQAGQQGNYPGMDNGWATEQALDLDMVSAMCPNCHILLVQATNASHANLAAAVNTAVRLGAKVVSNSYGGYEIPENANYESAYNHPGVAMTVSSGDWGYGTMFPASSPHVIAVGGTRLLKNTSVARGWTETAWNGAGSGCSAVFDKPVWQADALCTKRMVADVSAVADPASPVAIFYSSWFNNKGVVTGIWGGSGGTSVAAPIIAGIIGVRGGATPNSAQGIYAGWTANNALLNDVITGSNAWTGHDCGGTYFCNAAAGYDGPTGLGSPTGVAPF